MSLTAPSKVATETMAQYGIEIFDAQGNMKSLAEVSQILKARLYELELQKREDTLDEIRGPKTEIGFGNQIRSYVLYPYQMVKDLRCGVETSNVDGVLEDGDLDPFIIGYHRWATEQAE